MLYLIVLVTFLVRGQVAPPAPASEPPKQYKPEELCKVEGVVRNHATGEPLKKANIVLTRIGDPRSMGQPSAITTNAEGRFALTGLEPGQYRMSVERAGFVRMEYGGRPGAMAGGATLTLDNGQSMKDIEFRMAPHSVVTGRIVDEDGEPVSYAMVQLQTSRYFQGKRQLMPLGTATTNDLGEYRIFGVPAGKYYLSVTSRNHSMSFSMADEGFVPTYYPNAPDVASSSAVNVPLGRTVQGMDMTLRKMRTYRVKGTVTGAGGQRNQPGSVMLLPKDAGDFSYFMDRANTMFRGPKGEFELRGVRPGSYILRADFTEQPNTHYSARMPIDVTDRHVEGITVQLIPAGEVNGSVRVEGDAASLNVQDLTVYLQSRGGPMGTNSGMGRLKEGGTFSVPNISPDVYTIRVNSLPNEFYVKSARVADTDVLENGLNIENSGTANGLEIVVSSGAASFDGTVTNAKGDPVKGAAVILRPDTTKQDIVNLYQKVASSDQNGAYKLNGIAPGSYYLIAYEGGDLMEVQDPDLLQANQSSAVKLEVKVNERLSKSLKAVSLGDRTQ